MTKHDRKLRITQVAGTRSEIISPPNPVAHSAFERPRPFPAQSACHRGRSTRARGTGKVAHERTTKTSSADPHAGIYSPTDSFGTVENIYAWLLTGKFMRKYPETTTDGIDPCTAVTRR